MNHGAHPHPLEGLDVKAALVAGDKHSPVVQREGRLLFIGWSRLCAKSWSGYASAIRASY